VWWCAAHSRAVLMTSLALLAAELGLVARTEADIEKSAKAALRRLAEGRDVWLLVYDNVTAPEEIADFLPAAGARVLITSRFADWGDWAEQLELDLLPPEEASALLQTRAGRSDPDGARTLAESLGCLPLALDLAAAYCRRAQMSFAEYAAKAEKLIAIPQRGTAYPNTVAATFDLAIADVSARCPIAELLMFNLGLCAADRIPMFLAQAAIGDETACREAIIALYEVSLVKHDPLEDGIPAVTVHRLVQAVARERASAKGMGTLWMGLLVVLESIFPSAEDPTLWPRCATLVPHALALCDRESDADAKSFQYYPLMPTPKPIGECRAALLEDVGNYFHCRAAYAAALPLFERALAINEKINGSDHTTVAGSLNALAVLFRNTNRMAEAEPFFRRALAIDEESHGAEHPTVARALSNLAGLLNDTGRGAEAEPLYRRALAIGEKNYGPEHRDVATYLNNLAALLQADNRLAEAEPLYRHALAIAEHRYAPDHPIIGAYLNNLAELLRRTNRVAEAEQLQRRAMATSEKAYGPDHPDLAIKLTNLASLLYRSGRAAEAEPLFLRALAIDEKCYGPHHPLVGEDCAKLAELLLDAERFAESEPLLRRALTITERNHGSEHRDVATHLANIAAVLLRANRAAEAVPLLQRALAIKEKNDGPDDPSVATVLSSLAEALRMTNRPTEAEPLHRRALAIDEKHYGPNHPSVALRLNNVAYLLQATNCNAEAEPLYRRALAILGDDARATRRMSPYFELFCSNYARTLTAMGRNEEQIKAAIKSAFRGHEQ
jgi:tetratricopeptide (TPR) repeat protein